MKPLNPTVCCARLEKDVRASGELVRTDLGERPRLVVVDTPRALVWRHNASEQDIRKAQEWCKREGKAPECSPWIPILVPPGEKDPIRYAKEQVKTLTSI